jgi:pantoate--beta-alanine ligase
MRLTVLDRRDGFRKALDAERAAGRTIGLVPTMGALHAGHTSLMRQAAAECDVVVASLFVNRLQFGPAEDLATYPRDFDGDLAQAEMAGVAYLFAPTETEMFPEPPITAVTVAGLSDVLEGAARPGHFTGVATIVAKLLALAGPCRAYFGEKDYQQLAIIRRLVADLSLPAEIVGCPIVRAGDGLALSSRNAYLTPDQRSVAPALYQALLAGRAAAAARGAPTAPGGAGLLPPSARTAPTAPAGADLPAAPAAAAAPVDAESVRAAMVARVARHPAFQLDYAEVVDAIDLSPLTVVDRDARLLIAARLGRTRLIDNLAVPVIVTSAPNRPVT